VNSPPLWEKYITPCFAHDTVGPITETKKAPHSNASANVRSDSQFQQPRGRWVCHGPPSHPSILSTCAQPAISQPEMANHVTSLRTSLALTNDVSCNTLPSAYAKRRFASLRLPARTGRCAVSQSKARRHSLCQRRCLILAGVIRIPYIMSLSMSKQWIYTSLLRRGVHPPRQP